jgi:hypothetical protein
MTKPFRFTPFSRKTQRKKTSLRNIKTQPKVSLISMNFLQNRRRHEIGLNSVEIDNTITDLINICVYKSYVIYENERDEPDIYYEPLHSFYDYLIAR